MTDYKEPKITPSVIEQAARDDAFYRQLMARFEQCEQYNLAEYNRRTDAHVKIMAAINAAGFYLNRVANYMRQQYPAPPKPLGRLKKRTRAKIEAEQERLKQNEKQRAYYHVHKERTDAAIQTLTEYGYIERVDYVPRRAITFLKSVTELVEVPPDSGNFEQRVRSKFPQLSSGEVLLSGEVTS